MFDRIAKFKLNIEILLAGFDGDNARLFWINDETVEGIHELAYRAIGSGFIQATASVSRRGHDPSDSLPETVYALYEAKRAAEMVSGVGRHTDIAVLQPQRETRFLGREQLKELRRIYKRMKPRKLSDHDSGAIKSWFS
jgi:20S proteasome alpha/beta subunit